MTDEHSRLQRELEKFERQLETPISRERRIAIEDAITHTKKKQTALRRVCR